MAHLLGFQAEIDDGLLKPRRKRAVNHEIPLPR
jgi:hypothetical protein